MTELPKPDQGQMFNEEISHSGATDPALQDTETHYEPVPGGKFPETITTDITEPGIDVSEAVKTKHRHDAQVGKHSALVETGSYYDGLKVGDFLPGFGPVKPSNFENAKLFARTLDAERGKTR